LQSQVISTRQGGIAPVVPPVLREHLEEVAFLSIQRRKLLFAHDVPFLGFPSHDERIAAHWDGLAVGAPHSVQMALDGMDAFDPWEKYAAARVWMELGDPPPSATDVVARVEAGGPELFGVWREALRRIPRARMQQLFPPGSASIQNAAAVVVYALGAHDLLSDETAAAAVFSTDTDVRVGAARALGWTTAITRADALLGTLMNDREPAVQRAALWSTALRNTANAASYCRSRIRAGDADWFTFRSLGLLGNTQDVPLLTPMLQSDDGKRVLAAAALGDLLDPAAIPYLIEVLGSTDVAVVAAESIAKIAGAPPIGVEPSADGEPVPVDAAAARDWWSSASAAFPGGTRWLHGQQFPWTGAPAEEPMYSIWRSAFHFAQPDHEWLRREVPDGFFEPVLRPDAVPGE
jgi:HEAT repeat protein